MTLSISWSTSEQRSDGATMRSVSVEHVLSFDAVTSETHDTGSTITESPVEAGAPISDHKRPLQRRLSLEAVVTNTPIGRVPDSGDGSGEIAFSEQKSENANAVVRVRIDQGARAELTHTIDRLSGKADEFGRFMEGLAAGEGDLLIWIASISPTVVPPATSMPTIVLGTPDLNLSSTPAVFIPVGTPGLDHAARLIRVDNVVSLPLKNLGRTELPSAADILSAIQAAL